MHILQSKTCRNSCISWHLTHNLRTATLRIEGWELGRWKWSCRHQTEWLSAWRSFFDPLTQLARSDLVSKVLLESRHLLFADWCSDRCFGCWRARITGYCCARQRLAQERLPSGWYFFFDEGFRSDSLTQAESILGLARITQAIDSCEKDPTKTQSPICSVYLIAYPQYWWAAPELIACYLWQLFDVPAEYRLEGRTADSVWQWRLMLFSLKMRFEFTLD